ncbi:MAG: hypothetical protein SNJ83_14325 [Aggregatilineales bacterium]
MTTEDFIIMLFCAVDDQMLDVPKHPQAKLRPSEWVTIGLLFALKGGHFRVFYRWLKRDYEALFVALPTAPACNGHCRRIELSANGSWITPPSSRSLMRMELS